jgi:acetolactate synthase I/III small subunit
MLTTAKSRMASTSSKEMALSDSQKSHTISVYVKNQPGVLARIAQVFSRRAFNIDSLVVSRGRDARFSRMTIGVIGDPKVLNHIIQAVNKLIDVIHCFEHTESDAVVREMALIKLAAPSDQRTEILQVIDHFGGKTVDLTETSMVIMIAGNSSKVDAAVRLLSAYEIIETIRTGKVVMARGEKPT